MGETATYTPIAASTPSLNELDDDPGLVLRVLVPGIQGPIGPQGRGNIYRVFWNYVTHSYPTRPNAADFPPGTVEFFGPTTPTDWLFAADGTADTWVQTPIPTT